MEIHAKTVPNRKKSPSHNKGIPGQPHVYLYTVYSRYIVVGGVQAMVLQYKWERDISGDCHEPKSGSIFQRVVNDNGSVVSLAANSACRQRI